MLRISTPHGLLLPGILLFFSLVFLPLTTVQGTVETATKVSLVDVKCSKCHTLRRIFLMPRPEGEWHETIQRMADKNPQWISAEEAKLIEEEIINTRSDRVKAITAERQEYDNARLLFIDRCSSCHSVNRVLLKSKTPAEWKETVERMRSEAGDWISKEDGDRIAALLGERAEMLKEDKGGDIFVSKCLICHPGERILLETHDKTGWQAIVTKMRAIARDNLPMARFGNEEASMVVDLLVKTQGPEEPKGPGG
ncbi:MAG: hypothetical protein GY800_01885 [Planctomycetes bacterium]|nr:hypothetical protein [Planctomycetota bacterium]